MILRSHVHRDHPQPELAAEARLDGLYVVRTNVPAQELTDGETVQAYKDLARVERAFRSLKTVTWRYAPSATGWASGCGHTSSCACSLTTWNGT